MWKNDKKNSDGNGNVKQICLKIVTIFHKSKKTQCFPSLVLNFLCVLFPKIQEMKKKYRIWNGRKLIGCSFDVDRLYGSGKNRNMGKTFLTIGSPNVFDQYVKTGLTKLKHNFENVLPNWIWPQNRGDEPKKWKH